MGRMEGAGGVSSPGAFKTYANLWEGRNQVISIQSSMNVEGKG
jgi:hypothetical protein